MPEPLTTYITDGYNQGLYAYQSFSELESYLLSTAYFIGAENWAGAQTALISAAASVNEANARLLIELDVPTSLKYKWGKALEWIDAHGVFDYDITMASLLLAMNKATFNELQEFIAIIDAYKSAVLPAPYNADYYAGFVRKFAKWV
jgi:hypothetical protein